MKRRTRNYAKRQLTWMRKLAGVDLIDATAREPLALAREILAEALPRLRRLMRRSDSRNGRRSATTT